MLGMILAAVANTAVAQSSVTLFGVIDLALSYQYNGSPGGNSRLGLQQGNEGFLSGSRFGLKGSEDMGEGWKTGFVLENGFLANNGKLDQQGQLFGRQAFVKLGHDRYGEIALGRQYTTGNTMLYYVDPLGVGAAPSNSWQVYMVGQRYDNAFSYTGKVGPWQVIAEYAAGGIMGDRSARSSTSFGLRYTDDALTAVSSLQQTHDTQSRRARVFLAGVMVPIGDAKLFANYIHSERDAGFDSSDGGTDFASITSMSSGAPSAPVAINSVFEQRRRDNFFTLGASYRVTPAWLLTLSMMASHTTANGFTGTRKTWYGVADYRLSKRTDVYVATAYEKVNGGWSGLFGNSTTNANMAAGQMLNGKNDQFSALVGLRHFF
ncbi:TPA: porin [Salmonella enterica]|uniref:Porin n=1 Tax=Salmonella enterica TaxID=28901 RepID=A0A744CCX4_SALER|nr:porin [Salmonella enterica]HAF4920012.1 porin [Salmonella enterica]